jgi:hypothetical protein
MLMLASRSGRRGKPLNVVLSAFVGGDDSFGGVSRLASLTGTSSMTGGF